MIFVGNGVDGFTTKRPFWIALKRYFRDIRSHWVSLYGAVWLTRFVRPSCQLSCSLGFLVIRKPNSDRWANSRSRRGGSKPRILSVTISGGNWQADTTCQESHAKGDHGRERHTRRVPFDEGKREELALLRSFCTDVVDWIMYGEDHKSFCDDVSLRKSQCLRGSSIPYKALIVLSTGLGRSIVLMRLLLVVWLYSSSL